MAHSLEIKVRFYELDPYGHLNHSAFIQLFEVARVELLEEVGLELVGLEAEGVRFVVTGIETSFLRPVLSGQTVVVETEIMELRRASTRWRQHMRCGSDTVATQIVRAAVTDPDGRPTRVPDDVVARLRPHLSDDLA